MSPPMTSGFDLCSLPAELLYEILSHLDNASLVQLAWTCKMLQRISLNTFFERNDIQCPSNHWLVAYQSPPETLPALCAALWVKQFRQLHFYFNPGMDKLEAEVKHMYWLIKRLQRVDLVRLHFSVVDTWMWRNVTNRIQVLDRRRWFDSFSALLEAIIERGCTELQITGAGIMEEYYRPPSVDGTSTSVVDALQTGQPTLALERSNRRTSGRDLHGAATSKKRKRTKEWLISLPSKLRHLLNRKPLNLFMPQIPKLGGLSHLSILSDMLFLPTFFDWTLKSLAANSSSITTLWLRCSNLPTDRWSIFLASISLPHLGDFEFITDLVTQSTGAAFTDLREFFARHSTIHTLHLQGTDKFPGEQKIKVPVLPNLTSVMAPPKWISSLLETRHTRRGSLSKLVSIGISTEYQPLNFTFDYGLLNTALSHLSKFSGRQITLTLRFVYDNGVHSWFSTHAVLGAKNSVLSLLRCVSTLVISSAFYVDVTKVPMGVLLTWFSLFPSVERVRFVETLEEHRLVFQKPEFLKGIAERCPRMVSFNDVDLDEYR